MEVKTDQVADSHLTNLSLVFELKHFFLLELNTRRRLCFSENFTLKAIWLQLEVVYLHRS